MSDEPKVSGVETAKAESHFLAGDIATELVDGQDHFGKTSVQLLKHHGVYQQDDRDARSPSATGKSERSFRFMVRTKIPGGRLTSDQLLAELDLCDRIGNQTLRITTRQGLQLHGVLKEDLKRTIAHINAVKLSTLAACGDVERNVMCTPVPYKKDPVHTKMQQLAEQLAQHLCPRTTAYHEIWVEDTNGEYKERVYGGDEVEPIYGKTYLPRKFKTAVGLPGDNSVDLYAQDLGLMAVCEDFDIIGYNVLVGGSFGVTPSAKKTYVAIAEPMAFIRPEQVIDVATAVVKVQRDFGNRSDRKLARLKYTIAAMGGVLAFKQKVEEYYGAALDPPRSLPVVDFHDGLGWHEQGDGNWFYGLNIENGRIKDTPEMRLKSALREVCTQLRPGIRLTPHQSIIFCDIAADDRQRLVDILHRHGVKLSEEISIVRRWSMACPALPTCGLSITESERVLPGIIDQLEVELAKLGLQNERFTVRMTGCPNGCARPYNSDIGLVGKAMGKYTVFVGGRTLGDRLNFIHKDLVPEEEVVATLVSLFAFFKHERQPSETFGDFCHRQGNDALLSWSERHAVGR
jgi:sulfite reductase (ferredoxin)